MRTWSVKLAKIVWDDGKGEHDVSGLPSELILEAEAENSKEAIDDALDYASDEYGSLIADVEITVQPK